MSLPDYQLQTIDKEIIQSSQINEKETFSDEEELFNSCKDHLNAESDNESIKISDSKALSLLQIDQQTSLSSLHQSSQIC